MRIVLDTGVFYRPAAIHRLAASPDDVIVPTIVLAERIRQVVRDGFDPAAFRRVIDRCPFVVEPLGEEAATRWTARLADDERWHRLARDALIGGHVGNGDVLWTTNPRDFHDVGLPEDQVVEVP
jgi:predicted nucleic acid-binding protein